MARLPGLTTFLGVDLVVHASEAPSRRVDQCVLRWGRKTNTPGAEALAVRRGVPLLTLEDGFLRSVDLGVRGARPLSIVVDDVGIYYDATRPSRLEALLAAGGPNDPLEDEALLARARACIAKIHAARISKYNVSPERDLGDPATGCDERVLVVDQTAGDLSIELGGVVAGGFEAMLRAALDEHPTAEIVVNVHPDVASGKKPGVATTLAHPRVRLLTEPTHPASLLDQVDRVYAMTSLLGFEALLWRKPVTLFGVPFYAGWGLTDDRAAIPERRGRRRTIEQVFAAAYLLYARYLDPETGERCEAERVIEHLGLQRRYAEDHGKAFLGVGFSMQKRRFVPTFLGRPMNPVSFRSLLGFARRPRAHESLVVWGVKSDGGVAATEAARGTPVVRMEDGFLRSVGLGSDLYAPCSLVVDRSGIYFDPTRPSDLERLLAAASFDERDLARAARLRETIVALDVSKYNVGRRATLRLPDAAKGREVALVIGQVEDDASIRLGCIDVRRNLDLLRAAREQRPDAFVVYKPHPDVTIGKRLGHVPRAEAMRYADLVVDDLAVGACLAVADEVHTLTSLVGFEALLRGRRVYVYGHPFYAGWGLTYDRHPHPRRQRKLALDELVAGTLIHYPRYVHPKSGEFTTPEAIVEHLVALRERPNELAPLTQVRNAAMRVTRRATQLFAGGSRA